MTCNKQTDIAVCTLQLSFSFNACTAHVDRKLNNQCPLKKEMKEIMLTQCLNYIIPK